MVAAEACFSNTEKVFCILVVIKMSYLRVCSVYSLCMQAFVVNLQWNSMLLILQNHMS
jgi:hypothetical protein